MENRSASSFAPGQLHGDLVVRHPDELRLHPSLQRLGISPSVKDLSTAISQSHFRVQELITITHENYVISGLARWRVAKARAVEQIRCQQLPLGQDEALLWLIQQQQGAGAEILNPFLRIRLALVLESWFRDKAKANQSLGGQRSSNLTEATAIDVRFEIARVARASTGNITKVKQLICRGTRSVIDALSNGEVTIHRAHSWLSGDQNAQLRRYRLEREIAKSNRVLLRKQLAEQSNHEEINLRSLLNAFSTMPPELRDKVLVAETSFAEPIVLVSSMLMRVLQRQQDLPL